jgi:PAS domain S-box-containing protein
MPFQSNPRLKLLLSALIPILAACIQWQFWPILAPKTWILFYPAVFFSSAIGGLLGGMVATCLAALFGVYFFIDPLFTWVIGDADNQISLFIFVGMGLLFSLTFEYFHKTDKELQRHTDLELQVGQIRLKQALDAVDAGIWEWNTATNQLMWTDRMWRLLGLEPGSCEASYDLWLSTVHLDDRATVQDATQYAIENQSELNLEWRSAELIDGEQHWFLSRGQPDFKNTGKLQIYRGIVIDITERKQVESALQTSDNRFRAFMDNSPSIAWIKDEDGCHVYLSQSYEQRFGVSLEAWSGKTDFDLWPPDMAQKFRDNDLQVLRDGQPRQFFEETRDADGTTSYWLNTRFLIKDGDENSYIAGSGIDITELKLADQHLRDSESRIRLATEATGVGIWEWNVIRNIIRWDAQMFRIYGVVPSTDGLVPYSTWSGSVLPEELQRQEQLMHETILNRGQNSREFRILRANDGACRHIHAVETVRTNAEGEVEWVVGTNLDITERKQSEEALRASELRWQFALEGSHQGAWDYDLATEKVFFSNHWKSMLGYTAEQISDRLEEWSERVHPDDRGDVMETLNQHYRGETPFYESEHRLRNRHGDYIWTRSRGMVIRRTSSGEPLRIIGTQSDISEYRQLLDKLRDAENLARSIMDSLDIAIAVLDEHGNVIHINRIWKQLADKMSENWAIQQSVGQNYFASLRKLETISDAGYMLEALLAMRSGESFWFSREYACVINNIEHWFRMDALPLLGTVSGLVTLHTDITTSKSIQLKLEEKERLLADSQTVAHVGSWMLDLKTGQLTWSEETFRLYGLSSETAMAPGMEQFLELLHPSDRSLMQTWCEDCIAGKQPPKLDFRTRLINGEHRWLQGFGKLETDSNGEPLCMIGTVQDITHQKLAEVSIKDSAARIQSILDTVVDGIITIDKAGTIKTFNPAAELIFGYGSDEVIGSNIKMIMPEPFRSQHDCYLANYLAGGPARIIGIGRVVEGLRKNGTTFPLDLAVSETKLDEELIFTGIVRDITEREVAHAKLKDALIQKEVLLKEVYHRVKNNLQVVSSLINLQARNVKNEEALNLLNQSADRIKAMALLHEKLYQSKDLAKIDFKDYVGSLIESLLISFGIKTNQIKINSTINDVFLDLDTAIPCGLIINELLSNALKHAFPQDQPGIIEINFTREQNEFNLVISDNGIGFPDDLDIQKCKSLGLQLVTRLSKDQLRGRLSIEQNPGATFMIHFSRDQ